jgi:quercetin dioxygenase-like cupin family protein
MEVNISKTGIKNIAKIKEILQREGYSDIYTWSDSPGTYYDWHKHNFDEVRWVYKGSVKIGYDDTVVELQPGDKMEIPAGTEHWAETNEGVSYICGSKK